MLPYSWFMLKDDHLESVRERIHAQKRKHSSGTWPMAKSSRGSSTICPCYIIEIGLVGVKHQRQEFGASFAHMFGLDTSCPLNHGQIFERKEAKNSCSSTIASCAECCCLKQWKSAAIFGGNGKRIKVRRLLQYHQIIELPLTCSLSLHRHSPSENGDMHSKIN